VTVVLVISVVERLITSFSCCGEALRTDPPWRADNTHNCGPGPMSPWTSFLGGAASGRSIWPDFYKSRLVWRRRSATSISAVWIQKTSGLRTLVDDTGHVWLTGF